MLDTPIVLYAHQFRSRAERVLWTLKELEIEHTVKRLDASKGELASPEFLALNKAGKIPVMTIGDRVFTESIAMCEYLAKSQPQPQLLPETADEHYAYSRLMHFTITEIEAYLWVANQAGPLRKFYPWPDNTDALALKLATRNMRALKHLVDDGEYACCSRFTIIDIMLVQIIGWAIAVGIDVPQPLRSYSKHHLSRPSCPKSLRPAG
ncbi:MAG: glutathione S-transferase [Pseudomonadota bacterium]